MNSLAALATKLTGCAIAILLGLAIANPTFAAEMTTEETRALMKEYLKYHQSGSADDLEKWGAFYADDIEAHYHTTGPLGHYFFGREGFLAWYKGLSEGTNYAAGLKVDHRALIVDGNLAVTRYRVRSRRNGAPYVNEYVHIYTWEDQKIVHMEAFYNGAAGNAFRQLIQK